MPHPPSTSGAFSHYPGPTPRVRGLALVALPPRPCPYLPGRTERIRATLAESIDPGALEAMLDAGFRRSGRLLYQPICAGCRECVPLRVPVASFRPSASQRRVLRRNADLGVARVLEVDDREHHDLYRRYVRDWHGQPDDAADDAWREFLVRTPADTLHFDYRAPDGRLIAWGVCDRGVRVLSSVYFCFDPAESRRSLGTFGALREIAYAAQHGLSYYHLGYCVQGCPAMQYKAGFRPNQRLGTDAVWRDAP